MNTRAERLRLPAWARQGLAIIGVLLLLRALTVVHTGMLPVLPVAALADLATATFLWLLAPMLRPWALRLPAVVLIVLGYYAGAEHATTHGTLFRVAHLHHLFDAVFIASSVEGGESKAWLGVYAVAALPLLVLLGRPREGLAEAGLRLVGCALVVAAYGISIDSTTRPANNVVLGSIAQLPGVALRLRPEPQGEPDPPHREVARPQQEPTAEGERSEQTEAFFRREEAIGTQSSPENVLLIMVEGLSAGYLPSIARHQGLEPAIRLPELERALADRDFVTYRNALSLQRQTNRGTYALLCGDYPRITTVPAKMSEVAAEERPIECLPSLLAEAGFRTAYIQAAPLEFMQKDRFMAQAGFEHTVGLASEPDSDAESGAGDASEEANEDEKPAGWGPTDDRFFRQALEEVRALDAKPGPWFATLLNVGTHHPFTVQGAADEDDEDGRAEEDEVLPTAEGRREVRERAFRRMATALEELLAALERDGVLEDTAVIIAADESGSMLNPKGEPGLLDGNFGMLSVRLPEGQTAERVIDRDALVTQIDVPVTIADLVSLPNQGRMIGRSLLVPGPVSPRHLVFGDTYAGRTFFLRSDGELVTCDETFLRCNSWEFDPKRLIGTLQPSDNTPFLDLAERRRLAADTARIRPPEGRSERSTGD